MSEVSAVTPKKNSDSNIAIFIIAIVLTFGLILLVISINKIKNSDYNTPTGQFEQNISDTSYEVRMNNSGTWQENQESEVTIEFLTPPEEFPTVFTLEILYDPSLVEVISATEGNLWTEVNILQNNIDEEEGKLTLTVGQGFSAEPTGDLTLTTVTVVPKSSGATLTLGDESLVAKSGIGYKINSSQLNIVY